MPTYSVSAFTLSRRSIGEADRALTLYTRELGKLSAAAKGSRRPGSKLSGATEPFTRMNLLLASGRSLDIITQCEITWSYPGIREDIDRIARASYLCELLEALTHERDASASQPIFDLMHASFLMLEQGGAWVEAPVHAAEVRLLSHLGYAPAMDRCAYCGQGISDRAAWFSASMGGALCSEDGDKGADAIRVSSETLNLLRTFATCNPNMLLGMPPPSVKAACETASSIRRFIRFRSERRLKSAEFLDSLRASG